VVITTRKEESLISDLAETFDNLDRYKLKLNPTKCSFGVSAGPLLGFLVSARGISLLKDARLPAFSPCLRAPRLVHPLDA
jgi:hypothetical protein